MSIWRRDGALFLESKVSPSLRYTPPSIKLGSFLGACVAPIHSNILGSIPAFIFVNFPRVVSGTFGSNVYRWILKKKKKKKNIWSTSIRSQRKRKQQQFEWLHYSTNEENIYENAPNPTPRIINDCGAK